MPKARYIVFFSLLALFAAYLIISYVNIMINNDPPPPPRRPVELPDRGPILDRNGRFLAIQVRSADVSIWRLSIPKTGNSQKLPDLEEISREISVFLDMTPEEITNKVISSESNYISLKKQIDDSTARRLTAVIAEKKIRGVMVQPTVQRVYPEKNLAAQIIGFVGSDKDKGLEGIEFTFNNILNGADSDGKGSQVMLTIDTYVQHILEEVSAKVMEETGAESVLFTVMDPRTGDILGSVSLPDFDLNNFNLSNRESRMNRPAIWAFEPGSTFKVFSIAALMDSGVITSDTGFTCNGLYTPTRGLPINCMGNHGRVNARSIIIHSCNAGAAYASDNMNTNTFYRFLSDFGFGSRTGVGVSGETIGSPVPSRTWSERSKPTIAFGQEISVSAYQILQATTAIANDGILVPPRLIKKIVSADGKTVTEWTNGESRRILKPETARAMRSYMADTASTGAMGWRAGVQDISIGVKTGTSQMIDPATRKYSSTDFIASCVALLPAENPSLVLYLAVVKPKGNIYGARIAAPAIREAAEALIDYFGIPRGRNPQVAHPPSVNIPSGRLPSIGTHVPDFTGLSKRVLLPLLYRDDLSVEILGEGWVRRQIPSAGTLFTEGMKIVLELD